MCGGASSEAVLSAHRCYSHDWTLISISSFYMRYFRNCLSMCLPLFGATCGFNPSHYGCHLIVESVPCHYGRCATSLSKVCTWPFGRNISKTGGLGLVVSSLVLPDLLIYLQRIFSLRCNKKCCLWHALNSEMDLVARVFIATATNYETPGIFEYVCQFMSRQFLSVLWI